MNRVHTCLAKRTKLKPKERTIICDIRVIGSLITEKFAVTYTTNKYKYVSELQCGAISNRDLNAAKNILNIGRKSLGDLTCTERAVTNSMNCRELSYTELLYF